MSRLPSSILAQFSIRYGILVSLTRLKPSFLLGYVTYCYRICKIDSSSSRSEPLHHRISLFSPESLKALLLVLRFTSFTPWIYHSYPSVTISLYADDTGIVAHDADYDTAVAKLQSAVDSVAKWAKKWKIRINESKSVRVDFSLRPHAHDPTILDGSAVPVANSARYLGLHLDNKLNWSEHIRQKRVILDLLRFKFNWLLYSRQLSLHNKRLIYTSIFRPAWSYGAEIWGVAAASNIAVLERFQNKFLRSIARAPWFISNEQLQNELDIEPVQSVIMKRATRYVSRLHQHPNTEAIQLLDDTNDTTRLQRKKLSNLLL